MRGVGFCQIVNYSSSSVTIRPMIRRLFLLLTLAVLLVSCGTPTLTEGVTPSSPAQPTPADSATLAVPTDTPPPTPPPGLVLLAGAEVFPPEIQAASQSLAAESGWTLDTAPTLEAANLLPQTRLIVWLGDPAQARSLAEAAPQVRVIAFHSAAVEPTDNLSWIVADANQQAFLAGYLGMLVTDDWRSAGILPGEPPALTEAFQNGGRYLCGRCIPLYSPIVEFPVAASLPAGSPASAVLDAIGELNRQYYLETLFIHPQISSPELLAPLVGQDYRYIGLQSPPPELKSQWVATVTFDLAAALRLAWPAVDAESGGAIFTAPLVLQDVNEDILTEGKLGLLTPVLQDLQNGLIYPLFIAP